ncbi:MAG: hypothetical protein VXW17_00940, partial [Pseudomonadota bacterium]|nr:hypothetical protein [Pseudomonadota bacterium]
MDEHDEASMLSQLAAQEKRHAAALEQSRAEAAEAVRVAEGGGELTRSEQRMLRTKSSKHRARGGEASKPPSRRRREREALAASPEAIAQAERHARERERARVEMLEAARAAGVIDGHGRDPAMSVEIPKELMDTFSAAASAVNPRVPRGAVQRAPAGIKPPSSAPPVNVARVQSVEDAIHERDAASRPSKRNINARGSKRPATSPAVVQDPLANVDSTTLEAAVAAAEATRWVPYGHSTQHSVRRHRCARGRSRP